MNFLLNVIRIFFRNKWKEIKNLIHSAQYNSLLELLILIVVLVVVMSVLTAACIGMGYVLVEVLEWVTLIGDTSYGQIGMVFFIILFVVVGLLYAGYTFIKWIWTNIKIAIAEAKEL